MKKIILLVLIIIGLSGCQKNSVSDTQAIKSQLTYFKDERTGLCFATINSSTHSGYQVTSITCVPCDSLKKIGIR